MNIEYGKRHERTDRFIYTASLNGTETEVTFVFTDCQFDRVEYSGGDLSDVSYGKMAGYYSREGWRLLGWVNDKITDLTRRLNTEDVVP